MTEEPGHIEIVLAGGRRVRLTGLVDRRLLADMPALVVGGAAC